MLLVPHANSTLMGGILKFTRQSKYTEYLDFYLLLVYVSGISPITLTLLIMTEKDRTECYRLIAELTFLLNCVVVDRLGYVEVIFPSHEDM